MLPGAGRRPGDRIPDAPRMMPVSCAGSCVGTQGVAL